MNFCSHVADFFKASFPRVRFSLGDGADVASNDSELNDLAEREIRILTSCFHLIA